MRVNLNNFGKLGFIFIIFLLFRFSFLYASQNKSESTKLKYIWREAIEKNRNWDRFGALKEWTKAIDIAPNNHYLFYNRGLTYANLQLLTQAIKDFNESINSILSGEKNGSTDKKRRLIPCFSQRFSSLSMCSSYCA